MKNLIPLFFILVLSGCAMTSKEVGSKSFSQQEDVKKSKYLIGFNLALPTGIQPSTALTDASFGQPLDKSLGFGVIIQRKINKNINLLFDINNYNYNMFLASKGANVTSSWTLAEGAMNWDKPGSAQTLQVLNLPTDVHFDMQTTGFRLGGKYIFGDKKIQPWAGAAYGYYKWQANYFNENKSKSYGSDDGFVLGLTVLGGIDYELTKGVVISAFADILSPVASYTIEGLFYPQWNITDWQSPIFGQYRFGLTLSFAP